MKRLLHLVRKEFIELRRDPRLFGIVILAPIIQLTMLGYAATTDVPPMPDARSSPNAAPRCTEPASSATRRRAS